MSLETDIFNALGPLVGNRVYPLVFPQSPSIPITPAIRYQFISSETNADICGDGGSALANTRTQVDVVSATFLTARELRLQVISAMQALPTTTLWDGGFEDYDPETKLYRCSMDFLTFPSGG